MARPGLPSTPSPSSPPTVRWSRWSAASSPTRARSGIYRRLAAGRPGTFLLESAGARWGLESLFHRRCRESRDADGARRRGRLALGTRPSACPPVGNPVEVIRGHPRGPRDRADRRPSPLTSGLVGSIGYDAVRRWERLPETAAKGPRPPEVAVVLATDIAVVDHSDGSVLLVANAINYDDTGERVEWAGRTPWSASTG